MNRVLTRIVFVFFALSLALTFTGCTRQAKANRHFSKGEKYFASGNYDSAEIEFINTLRNQPENSAAMARLATIYAEQGRASRALPFLFRALKMNTNNANLRLRAGFVSLAIDKNSEARGHALFVLNQNPKNDDAPILLANASETPQEISNTRQQLQQLVAKGDRAAYQIALGILNLREKDMNAAEAAFKRAQALDAKLPQVYTAWGNLARMREDLKAAEAAFKTAAELSPARSPRRIDYAQIKFQSGDIAGTRSYLQEVVKEAPDFILAWQVLAEMNFNEKKYEDCASGLAKILARDAANFDALILNGRVFLATGEPKKALLEFEKAVKAYPHSARAQHQLALALLANDETAKAETSLAEALKLNPNFGEAILLQAELRIGRGDFVSSVAELQKFTKQYPKSMPAWMLLARAYRAQGKLEEALTIHRQLQAAAPKNPQLAFLTGLICRELKKNDEARKAMSLALELDPDYLQAAEQLADMDIADKQFGAALQRAQQQIDRKPKQPEPWLLQAGIYVAQSNTNQAIAALRKAMEIQPDFRPATILLARLYVSSGETAKALQELGQVTAKNPKDRGAFMLMGMINEQNRDFKNARDCYEKALAADPNYTPAANNLAYLYCEQFGELDKAYTLARKAREVQKNDPSSADTLGWILYKRGEFGDALNLLQESASKMPNNLEAQAHLGLAYYKLGMEDPARAIFQTILQNKAEFTGKAECNARLAILNLNAATGGKEARAALEKRLTEDPADGPALLRMANCLEHDGQFAQAAEYCQKALQNGSNNVPALTCLARLNATRLNQPQKAYELAKAAYKLAPSDVSVALLMGRLAAQNGDCKLAASLLQTASRAQPNNANIWQDLAEACYGLGQLAEAQSAAQAAQKNGGTGGFTRLEDTRRLIEFLTLASNPAQAVAAQARVEQTLKATPDYAPAWGVSALIAEQKKDFATARQACEKLLARYPDHIVANRQYALLCLEESVDDRKALAAATKARDAFPADSQVAKAMGVINYRLGDYNRASTLLKDAQLKLAADADIAFYLGMAQYQLKQKADSKKSLQRALELKLAANRTTEAQRVLAELK